MFFILLKRKEANFCLGCCFSRILRFEHCPYPLNLFREYSATLVTLIWHIELSNKVFFFSGMMKFGGRGEVTEGSVVCSSINSPSFELMGFFFLNFLLNSWECVSSLRPSIWLPVLLVFSCTN